MASLGVSTLFRCIFAVFFITVVRSDEEGAIRLMDGASSGRLEIFHFDEPGAHGVWGSICKDGWGYDEARVACRQLGFPFVTTSFKIPLYGPGNGPIHLSKVKCSGVEQTLLSCPQLRWDENGCNHTDVVGVECSYIQSNDTTTNTWYTPQPDTQQGVALVGWAIAVVVMGGFLVLGIIGVFVGLCCYTNQRPPQNTFSSPPVYLTAGATSIGQQSVEPPPSYDTVLSDFPAEKD
ncbi:scavenger receptor cysteine-rich domain-containing protein SCART1-like [Lytechinus pictus]|uniref:scavenger receptor cysteine-rich domain-containing protein SCART1-like n=1 Tax=Lytechinus pictus TaxID=7653 RepID=UPI0030B9BF8D